MSAPKGFLRLDGMDGHVYIKRDRIVAFNDIEPDDNGDPHVWIILKSGSEFVNINALGTADELSEALTKARK